MTSQLRGTSSSARTLDQRDLASLRPAKKSPRLPRKRAATREIASGIICFCGERFNESQSLDFMLHLRAEVGADLAALERRRESDRRYNRERSADPERREVLKRQNRASYQRQYADPERRANIQARNREASRSRRADPTRRERENARRRERYATDPEFRMKLLEKNRRSSRMRNIPEGNS